MTVAPSDVPLRHAWFVEFHFKTATVRVWTGFRLIHINGQDWLPVGNYGALKEIAEPITGSAPSTELRLSGVDSTALTKALANTDEVRGQLVFIYDQYFDSAWQPDGSFEAYSVLKMDTVKVTRQRNGDDSWERVIVVPCEYLLVTGSSPPNGRYTSADQAARHPGVTDHYFEFMGQNQNKRIRWPTF